MTPDPHAHAVPSLAPATVAVTAGRPSRVQGGPVNPPVVLSSTYVSRGIPGDEPLYARGGTETWESFEQALAALEGGEHGIVLGSGMAAIAAAIGDLPPGSTVVVPRHAYQVTLGYLDDRAARYDVEVRRVDVADTEAVVAALDGADLLVVESPTNPMLEIADLPALLAAARDRGVRSVVDNTFATPLGQQPLALGADVVVHSVTKYLSGHTDVVLGAVVTNDDRIAADVRSYRTLHGAIAGPMEVFLALRGLRTLHLRVERAAANAVELARRLHDHPAVAEVRHPSLPDDPGHGRAAAQMAHFGAVVGVRPVGGRNAADALVDAVRLWVPATSLGGVESLLERRRRLATESPTVPEDLVRLSVGVEDVEDLWADLAQALERATA
ncbi:PLP-dependent aspartate aminotransferase family protein [Isoptericola sp. b408]|uniref:trans-sulfuration enzyme family protein n=1 Tax=Isoptericola sp. b408 TaxID=3064653 RepID=UPI002713D8AA|nr:PLP-dependent aspartate aminotransferase family protein [Isoptericola sp. b408]MDO8150958.1 PLP-dependent aspartate aminotransferase family protein [Isoptericola sp. b408]